MATVRITNDIRSHVYHQIRLMFKNRIAREQGLLDTLGVGEQIWRKVVPEQERNLAVQLEALNPGQWCSKPQSIYVDIRYTTFDGSERKMRFVVTFRPPVPAPMGFGSGTRELTPEMEAYEHVAKICSNIDQIQSEQEKLVKFAETLLNTHSTLKPALETWPSLMDYLPTTAVTQHNQKIEKVTREKKEVVVDDETMALLLKARLMQTP